MRAMHVIILLSLFAGATASVAREGAGAPRDRLSEARRQLSEAKRTAILAAARADRLTAAAARERRQADRINARQRALAAKVVAAQADIEAARLRVTIIDRLLTDQRAALGAAQTPIARLLAALQALARRPTIVAVAQRGSVDDLVHVRAVLGTALPVVRAQTQGVRAALDRTRRLQAGAVLAATALREGRARLEANRSALATLEADHRARSQAFGRTAISESDRALAMGERARDLVDGMAVADLAEATARDLAALPGPSPRPVAPGSIVPAAAHGIYRLPVRGQLMTGFDEVSAAGVRSRGLTFAVAPRARVVAPAAGLVRYAGRFRSYGTIVIIDHGAGWSSLVTGLSATPVKPGARVAMGAPIGIAQRSEPRVTVELRRQGRAVDAAALIG